MTRERTTMKASLAVTLLLALMLAIAKAEAAHD